MRTRNALTRLAAVAPSAEPVLDAGEEARILARILASPRAARSRRPLKSALAALAVVAAAALAASLELDGSHTPATHGNRPVALTGARIEMAGYHFRTPAGFKASDKPCAPGGPLKGFSAASADGGCVEAADLMAPRNAIPPGAALAIDAGSIPADAVAIPVGNYSGYYHSGHSPGQSTLYVDLPEARLTLVHPIYLVLRAVGLTQDQLVAVALSGLSG